MGIAVRNFMVKLQFISGVMAVLLVMSSAFLIIVDGVAIIFTYVSLILAVCSVNKNNIKLLKIYGVIFVVSHIILAWRVNSDLHQSYSEHPPAAMSSKQPEIM